MAEPQCNLIIDSCCDLPHDIVEVDGVEVFQFPYLLDESERSDDMFATMTPHEFYEKMRKGSTPSTAQIKIPAFTELFTRAIESGVPTVYLSFTSGLSGSCDTARLVRDQLVAARPEAELYVVDTRLPSIAEGVLVYEAIRQRALGLTAQEMVKWAEEARYYVNDMFMVDDLESLRRGGRIPASVAFAGSKLDVKPLLNAEALEGKLALVGVARGRKKGIRQLAEFYRKRAVDTGVGNRVVIGSSDCPKDVDRLKAELSKIDESVLFLETSIGPVIGSHVGPGMLAIAFMGPDVREEVSVSDRIARKVRSK